MLFEDLYDSCFRDLPVVLHSNSKEEKDVKSCVTTLDNVVSSCKYVVFFVSCGGGNRVIELTKTLDSLVRRKNGEVEGDSKEHSSPTRIRRLFGLGKKKKKSKSSNSIDRPSPDGSTVVSVVRLSSLPDDKGTDEWPEGWFGLVASEDARVRSRLLRSLHIETSPSVIIVDSASHRILTTDGRRLLIEDPSGQDFPWPTPELSTVFPLDTPLVKWENGEVKKVEGTQKPAVRALLFGASWCPPCREWVKQLSPIYSSLRSQDRSFELIFCSSDRSQDAFNSFLSQMPWTALPYDPSKTITLTRVFRVNGIPSLILLDESNRVISRHGRSVLLEDPKGSQFPWRNRALYELTEHSVCRLKEEPSLILFTEGSIDDVRFSLSILEEIGNVLSEERKERDERGANGKSEKNPTPSTDSSSTESVAPPLPAYADPLQVFYTGEDAICDYVLERVLGMGEAELPLVVIVDAVAGVYAVCEDEDVSRDVVHNFVNAYKGGKLEWKVLPPSDHRTVAGIPASVLREATRQSSLLFSPSQDSILEHNENQPQAIS